MFTFPILAVRKVIARGEEDAAANGGFRNPYYGTRPGEGEKPGHDVLPLCGRVLVPVIFIRGPNDMAPTIGLVNTTSG